MFITGGAGFIGSNAAAYFAKSGWKVTIFDNFSRDGGKENVAWLKKTLNKQVSIVNGDVRHDRSELTRLVKHADAVIHLAAQVAVTTSVVNPREDFEINALGTFNLLEAVRESGHKPVVLYSSTNKVYGQLENIATVETKTRYEFKNLTNGVPETQCLDFHSPYGCSKGVADQYVRDYSRIYGLPTVVLRQSCIYGPHQHGVEDQGWVAWFIIALSKNKPLTIYGNGKQVRDILYVDDLIRAYDMAIRKIKVTKGEIYNIGGGSENTLSIWFEFKPILEKLFNKKIKAKYSAVRPGDQPIFISDIRKAAVDLNWKPKVGVREGIGMLYDWIMKNGKEM